MPAYLWKAVNTKGGYENGILEGDSERQVRAKLRAKNLAPVYVELSEKESANRKRTTHSLKTPDLALIARQMATLLHAGLPLQEVLNITARQMTNPKHENLLLSVRAKVSEGFSLSRALQDFPKAFPEHFCATVAAGEQSGHLATVLDRLAEHAEKSHETHQKMQLALMYPLIVTLVAIVVIIALVTYVVPQVVQVFENMDQQLPLLTRGLIAVSDWLREKGILTLILLLTTGLMVRMLVSRNRKLQFALHNWLLHLPGIGNFIQDTLSARFCRISGMLFDSSVPATDCMAIAPNVIGFLPIREALSKAAENIRGGMSMQAALNKTGYFSPLVINLVSSGEASGRLGEMLLRAAETQERDNSMKIATLIGIFEPLMILVMGGIVLLVVLAILLPIFEMNQMIG